MFKKIFKFIRKRWYLVLILILIGGFLYYRQQAALKKLAEERTYTVSRQTAKDTLSFSGEIKADETAQLKFQTSGKLNWVGVKEGDRVEKWQTLAQLDTTEAYKNLQKTLRDYSKERNDFDQDYFVTYREQTPYSALTDTLKRILEKNQWDLDKAVLDVELKDYALKQATLTTPIAGIVTRVDNPVAGVNIVYTASEIDVVNPESIYFSATADQTEVVKLKEGMTADLVFDSYSDETIQGSITSISFTPRTDETGTVYEIEIGFNTDSDVLKYRLGMTGDVTFTLKERPDVLSLPLSAVKKEGDKDYVFIKKGNSKEKVYVETGETFDSSVEILSGFSEGDTVYD